MIDKMRARVFFETIVAPDRPTLRELETEYILYVLDRHNGYKPDAAKELGIALKTLYNKINEIEAACEPTRCRNRPCESFVTKGSWRQI